MFAQRRWRRRRSPRRSGCPRADLYPQFVLAGSIGLAGDSFSDQFESGSKDGFVTPLISWNIFNYGRIRNNVRVQDARFQQLVVTYENVVLNALREVEDGLAGFLPIAGRVRLPGSGGHRVATVCGTVDDPVRRRTRGLPESRK